MDSFEQKVRTALKSLRPEDKIYLKKNYHYELFGKHAISEEDIDLIFNPMHIISIAQNIAFSERIDVVVQLHKNKRLKIIIQLDPTMGDKKYVGKIGIITAFLI